MPLHILVNITDNFDNETMLLYLSAFDAIDAIHSLADNSIPSLMSPSPGKIKLKAGVLSTSRQSHIENQALPII